MDEPTALRRIKRGDEAALEWVIDRYAPYVSTVIYNIAGSAMPISDVEELSSDVFVALWRNAEKVKPGKLKAWLAAVARNKARDRLRGMGAELPLEEDILWLGDMQADIEQREQSRFVKLAVLAMPCPEREIFLRHYYYCQSIEQISSEMAINPNTVKTKLRRGRERLRQVIIKGGYGK